VADFFSKRTEAQTKGPAHETISEEQRVAYPFLSKMLEGIRNLEGKTQAPKFSLTLFAAEGEIRFSFKASEVFGGETWFGTAGRSADILGAIEIAIENGALDRKREKPLTARPTH